MGQGEAPQTDRAHPREAWRDAGVCGLDAARTVSKFAEVRVAWNDDAHQKQGDGAVGRARCRFPVPAPSPAGRDSRAMAGATPFRRVSPRGLFTRSRSRHARPVADLPAPIFSTVTREGATCVQNRPPLPIYTYYNCGSPEMTVSVPPEQAHHYRKWGISSQAHKAYVLESPVWFEKRNACKRRANWKCEDCGKSKVKLEAHHLTYERFGAELPDDLRCLCQPCHARRHNGKWARAEKKRLAAAKVAQEKLTAAQCEARELRDARWRCNRRRAREAAIARSKAFWSGKLKKGAQV